jgi:hypothetical protein
MEPLARSRCTSSVGKEETMKIARTCAAMAAGALALAGYAAGAGPSPGLDAGIGVKRPGGDVRFLALAAGRGTLVEKVRVHGGRVVRSRYLKGHFGVPLVTYGGDTGGLARHAPRLVLASGAGGQGTRFLVLDPRTLKVRQRITLHGAYAFDALSPDGSILYLLQLRDLDNSVSYSVRAFDLDKQRFYRGAIVDRREPDEKMNGLPVTRMESGGGTWAYTLYSRTDKKPFVHALDTAHRRAVCIDLRSLPANVDWLWKVRMRMEAHRVVLVRGSKVLARIDTKTFEVSPG